MKASRIASIIITILVFAAVLVTFWNLFIGNRQVFDTAMHFDHAMIKLADGEIIEGMVDYICGSSQFFTDLQQSVDPNWTEWQRFIAGPQFIFKKESAICPTCSAELNNRLKAAVYEIKKKNK